MKKEHKISEIPQYKNLSDQVNMLGCLSYFLPFLFTKDQRRELKNMREKVDELRRLPDEFNTLFLERGWICFDSMSSDLLKNCVVLGKNGDIEKAEQALIDFYKGDISYLVYPLRNLSGFKERYELLIKALDDYRESRYHACVPVFLMITDGVVNQVLKKNLGAFAENADLKLSDSAVGHPTGLPSLIKIISATHKATNTNEILIPYRNGILHGIDVNYDNVYVASKSLAVLFAVADWVRDYSKGRNMKPIEDGDVSSSKTVEDMVESLSAMVQQREELNREKKMLEEWRPRNFENIDFASFASEEGTPEYRVCELFEFYTKSNYGKMASILTGLRETSDGKMAGEVRKLLSDIKCTGFKIVGINDQAAAVSEVYLILSVVVDGVAKDIDVKARVLYQADKVICNPLVRGDSRGQWYVLNTMLYEIVRKTAEIYTKKY